MNKELEKILGRAEKALSGFPEKRRAAADKLAAADAEVIRAGDALERAEDYSVYLDCEEKLKEAKVKAKFAEKALRKLDAAQRMDEATYNADVATCKRIADSAVSVYRSKTTALMEQLKAVHEEYVNTMAEANSALVALDNAANILQSKHPYKITTYTGNLSKRTPDPNAWREYATRYDNGKPYKLATQCGPNDQNSTGSDRTLSAAWRAIHWAYGI